MSTHEAVVVEVKLEPHNNADSLSIIRIGGFQVVGNTESWQGKDKGIYVLPDSIVDTKRPEFAFLAPKAGPDGKYRVKCVRLRGEFSQGLLVPAPEDAEIGQDFWEQLGLEWYEPELHLFTTGGDFAPAPAAWGGLSKYDVDNGRRAEVSRWFNEGEDVYVTEKLNGANCSFVFSEDKIHVRSRSGFRAEVDDMFHKALKNSPQVEKFCRENPDTLVYGEAYGNVKGFKYDCKNGEIKFRVFDIMQSDRTYLNYDALAHTCAVYSIETAPLVGIKKFNLQELIELAEQPSILGNPICEGIVIKPLVERRYGNNRVMMKIVSNKYLEKS